MSLAVTTFKSYDQTAIEPFRLKEEKPHRHASGRKYTPSSSNMAKQIQALPSYLEYSSSTSNTLTHKRVNSIPKPGELVPAKRLASGNKYTTMIGQMVNQNNLLAASDLWNEMKRFGIQPLLLTFNMMIKLHGNYRDVEQAFLLFEEMQLKNFYPDLYTYNTLINLCGKCGELIRALGLLEKMKGKGVEPDHSTYNTLIKYFAANEQLTVSAVILEQMWDAGLKPDVFTYNILLKVYAGYGSDEDLNGVLKKMHVPWNKATYTILMDFYQKNGHPYICRSYFDQMVRAGIEPDERVYRILNRLSY